MGFVLGPAWRRARVLTGAELTELRYAGKVATLLTKPESDETLKRFYAHARPCGFWGPVARQLGEDPAAPQRGFWRALGATALASISLFCFLVGVGTWMSRAPHGLASAGPILLIGIGLALIPGWARLGFREKKPC